MISSSHLLLVDAMDGHVKVAGIRCGSVKLLKSLMRHMDWKEEKHR